MIDFLALLRILQPRRIIDNVLRELLDARRCDQTDHERALLGWRQGDGDDPAGRDRMMSL
jgi:hypothetical protein